MVLLALRADVVLLALLLALDALMVTLVVEENFLVVDLPLEEEMLVFLIPLAEVDFLLPFFLEATVLLSLIFVSVFLVIEIFLGLTTVTL